MQFEYEKKKGEKKNQRNISSLKKNNQICCFTKHGHVLLFKYLKRRKTKDPHCFWEKMKSDEYF